jgi:hypothetical protein
MYYRRGYVNRNNTGPRHEGDKVLSKFKELDSLGENNELTEWESNFLQSIRKGYEKYGSLTEGQFSTVEKILKRHCPEARKAREDWRASFGPVQRYNLEVMAKYYGANPPYFAQAAKQILSEPDFIPTQKLYKAMCENKYAQRVLDLAASDHKFSIGDICQVRESKAVTLHPKLKGRLVAILETKEDIVNAAKGARRYLAVVLGETEPFTVEERWLKKMPKRLG